MVEADEGFAESGVAACRKGNRVTNEVVDPRRARGGDVSGPGNLEWRRPPGEDAGTRLVEVAGQVDQDVDPVGGNGLGRCGVIKGIEIGKTIKAVDDVSTQRAIVIAA